MAHPPTIQLQQFCQLFDFPDRPVRFVLEQGFVPKGVDPHPATGNRREFGPRQAFWLAITMYLKSGGLKVPAAAVIADIAIEGIRGAAQNLSWDPTFLPFEGWFETGHRYFVDVAERQFIRLTTDAYPSREGLQELIWAPVDRRHMPPKNFAPCVFIRVDASAIARVLSKVDGWKCPHL